jgi:hypothetical protein
MGETVTILLVDDLLKQHDLQAKLIKESKARVIFSGVLNDTLRTGLKSKSISQ